MTDRYYKQADIIGGKYFRSPNWNKKDFSDIPGRELIIQEGDRLDIIAEKLFGDSKLWKALAIYNGLGYFFELQPGERLYIPNKIKDLLDRI